MGLKNIIKKAGMAVGGLLLACNIGCHSKFEEPSLSQGLENKVSISESEDKAKSEVSEPKMKKWQYPVNIFGGLVSYCFLHETAHAAVISSLGYEITEAHLIPFTPNPYNHPFTYLIVPELDNNPPDSDLAAIKIAGPLADFALTETINYNLRNDKISPNHQPFWATTSLISRGLSFYNALKGISERESLGNDWAAFSSATGTNPELWLIANALYEGLSWKRMRDEWNAATGRKYYPHDKEKKTRLDLLPTPNGLSLVCEHKF